LRIPDAPGMASVRALWGWLYGRPYLLLTLASLMWGGNAVASRLALGHISPLALNFLRWGGVCVVLLPLFGHEIVRARAVLSERWFYIVAAAGLGFTGFNAMMYTAAHYTSAVNITILQGSIPVFVLVGGLAWFGTRIRLLQILGMAVTLIGIAAVAAQGDPARLASLSVNVGDAWMVVACAAWSAYTLALRQRPPVSSYVLFAAMAAAGFVLSFPLVVYEAASGAAVWPDAAGWAIVAFVALFPSLAAQVTFMRGVELIGPARAGLFANLVPVFGAVLAVGILGEPFRAYHALAMVLVLAGIWLAEQKRV
jgi:drug/metabolite transporter (DMT)-like permease